jgi:pimeloyl-ACP methyl ester carboxylesterase
LWLVELLREAAIGPTIVCGHSYGGALAIELALLGADGIDLDGLVLIATGARLRVSPMILQMMEQAAVSGTSASLGSIALRDTGDADLAGRVDAVARLTPPQAALSDWRAANAFDRMGNLASIALPTLVIAGERDVLTPTKFSRYLADHISESSIAIVPGAGHMVIAEEAAECATLLRNFAARS